MAVNAGLDVARIKKDFPILDREINGTRLVYLDSASTSQKPRQVLDAMERYYEQCNANVHRSVYHIAGEATEAYETARLKVRRFINASTEREVVFTKNATEGLNLVAYSWGRANLREGDVVVLTHMEHHANIVPWHILASERGIELRWVPLTPQGLLDLTDLHALLDGAKAFGFAAMSNVLGTINPVRQLCDAAHAHGALAIVDACQYVPHVPTDVAAMGADFIAFSAHKMCGPTGIGVLWGREELLEAMPPFLGGGDMIRDVRLDGFTPNELPVKFEAGTPPIAEAIGFGAAVDYLTELGMTNVRQHEMSVTGYAIDSLTDRFGDDIKIHGPRNVELRGGALSFEFRDLHPHDVSQVLDQTNVCVRAGHHCAKPLMRELGVNATARASFYVYNDEADVNALADGLDAATDFFTA
ncbi:MAG TPA: SufS family cysteine desulfurase [Acidimicrobiales bacterium]|nr:SufS family cysteine desulfurase [Acidimicrobiales bacterium]